MKQETAIKLNVHMKIVADILQREWGVPVEVEGYSLNDTEFSVSFVNTNIEFSDGQPCKHDACLTEVPCSLCGRVSATGIVFKSLKETKLIESLVKP